MWPWRCRDKAGAYAIQNTAFHPVSSIKGCYANIIGLPMCYLAPILLQHNIKPQQPNEDFNNCCLNKILEDHQRAHCCQNIWYFDEEMSKLNHETKTCLCLF
jgi:hypothetical protein